MAEAKATETAAKAAAKSQMKTSRVNKGANEECAEARKQVAAYFPCMRADTPPWDRRRACAPGATPL